MALLPLTPNWGESVRSTYAFLTDILTSHDGSEQRIARRQTPRRRVEFTAHLPVDRYRQIDALLRRPQAARHTLPDVTGPIAFLGTSLPAGASVLTVNSVPAWLVPGAEVVLVDGIRLEARKATIVAGNAVTLDAPTAQPWIAGAILCPAVPVDLGDATTATALLSTYATMRVSADVQPGELPIDAGSPEATLFGRELWLRRPNWKQVPEVVFAQPIERQDANYGVVGRYAHVKVGHRTTQFLYSGRSREQAFDLLRFFTRMRGRRGEFFAPTWMHDMTPRVDIAAGTALDVEDPTLAESFGDLETYRAVAIDTLSHGPLVRGVTGITSDGTRSVLTLSSALPAIDRRDVLMISWVPLCRLGTDDMTLDWQTDSYASTVLNVVALPFREAD